MLNNKRRDPVYITKICIIILVLAFAAFAAGAIFGPRAQADDGETHEKAIPGNIVLTPGSGILLEWLVEEGEEVFSDTTIARIEVNGISVDIKASARGNIFKKLKQGDVFEKDRPLAEISVEIINVTDFGKKIWQTTSLFAFISEPEELVTPSGEKFVVYGWMKLLMIAVGFVLVYLGVARGFEPLLLVPIGFGTIFVNIPFAGMGSPGIWNESLKIFEHQGFLDIIYKSGVGNEFFPLIIFIGIGAMTDFGPLIANPKTALLGAAAQVGVFGTMFFVSLSNYIPGIVFNLKEACGISIIGGADGPTTIYIAAKLAPHLMATVAVAAYSYMALVPIIQPPIMKLLTTKKERLIKMKQLRPVSDKEKLFFPIVVFFLSLLLIPSAAPLVGCLMFGNFLRVCKVVDRLSDTAQNALMNVVSMFLSLGVGSQMTPEKFLNSKSLIIIVMGLIAFAIATASGLLVAKFMNLFLKEKINPLIGSAGVSAVPMAARVSNKVGQQYDPGNFLLMHAMGPNVAGVIGTAIAAGVMIAVYGG